MKDPLQPDPTPYDLLRVGRGASAAEIEQAFKSGLRLQNISKLTAARRQLQDPLERALVDAFLYEPENLGRMQPNPLADADVLLPPRRDATEDAWRALVRAAFPAIGPTHCWSVLCYWSAVARGDADAWESALAGWAMLIASDPYLSTLAAPDRQAVAARLEQRLLTDLREREQHSLETGNATSAQMYRQLSISFRAELTTARRVAQAAFTINGLPVVCGPRLLEQLSWTGALEQLLDWNERADPSNAVIPQLRDALSPAARAAVLIEAGEPEQAVSLIESMAANVRASDPARRLLFEAWRVIGRRRAEADQPIAALDAWEQAVRSGLRDGPVLLHDEVTRFCLARAGALQLSDRDKAIALLERGARIVDAPTLRANLAELLLRRARVRVDALYREHDVEHKGESPALLGGLHDALADAQRAATLGSSASESAVRDLRSLIARSEWAGRSGRKIEFNTLPGPARRRFVERAVGSGPGAYLLLDPWKMRVGSVVGCLMIGLLSFLAFAVTVFTGFGGPGGAAVHGITALPWYVLVVFGMTFTATEVVNAIVRSRLTPYQRGRYVFPLDIVDATSSTLVVSPMKGLVKIEPFHSYDSGTYRESTVTLEFKDGVKQIFTLSSKQEADEFVKALRDAGAAESAALARGDLAPLYDLDPLRAA